MRRAFPGLLPRQNTPGGAPLFSPPPGTVIVYPDWTNSPGKYLVRDWVSNMPDVTGDDTAGLDTALARIKYYRASGTGNGGTILLGEGTYTLSDSFILDLSGVTLMGMGNATIITNDTAVTGNGLIELSAVSDVTIKNLKISTSASVNPKSCIYNDGGAAARSNIRFEDLDIIQNFDDQRGIQFTANAGTGWDRIYFRNVYVQYTGATTGWNHASAFTQGILVSGGPSTGSKSTHLFMENVHIDGFFRGFDSGGDGSTNEWEDCQITNLVCENCFERGARFYHMGELQITNALFKNNGIGAWFDQGATSGGNYQDTISNVRCIDNNVVGFFIQEWEDALLSNVLCVGNRYGAWIGAGKRIGFNNLVCNLNDIWGISTDKGAVLTKDGPDLTHGATNVTMSYAAGTVTVTETTHGRSTGDFVNITNDSDSDNYKGTYSITVTGASTYTFSLAPAPATTSGVTAVASTGAYVENDHLGAVESIKLTGGSCCGNGQDGILWLGVGLSNGIDGMVVENNGTDGSGSPSTSGYAEIRVGEDSTGSNDQTVSITGCSIGKGTGGDVTGGTQYGIYDPETTSTIATLHIASNTFLQLEDALSIAQTANGCSVVANNFTVCNAITLPTDGNNGYTYMGNSITGGSLAGNVQWDGMTREMFTGPKKFVDAGTPESVVTAPVGSLFMRTDGGASTTLYVKESGTGNTGWVAK